MLFDRADAEAEIADARVGELGLKCGEDALFLKREFLDDRGVGDGDFKHAAADSAGAGELRERLASGCLPGGREVGIGLDAAVAAGGNQLGQHVGDFFRAPGVVTPLLALAASGEFGSGIVGGVDLQSCVSASRIRRGRPRQAARGLAVAGERHDYVAVAVVGAADGGRVAVLQVDRECLLGFEYFQKIDHESRVERDRNWLAVVGNRQLDSRLANFGRLA